MPKKQDQEDGADKSGPALVVTIAWTGAVISYTLLRWEKFNCMDPNEVGDFLAGAFGPVALLWLVFGYMQQGRELRMQAKELRNAVVQHKELVSATREQIAADTRARDEALAHARQQVRPRFEGQVFKDAVDPEERMWIIQIEAVGPDCQGVTAQLVMVAEQIPIPISLDRFNESDGRAAPREWQGSLPASNAAPDVLHIQCITSRNEIETQHYRLVPDMRDHWRLDEAPFRANATPIRYPA